MYKMTSHLLLAVVTILMISNKELTWIAWVSVTFSKVIIAACIPAQKSYSWRNCFVLGRSAISRMNSIKCFNDFSSKDLKIKTYIILNILWNTRIKLTECDAILSMWILKSFEHLNREECFHLHPESSSFYTPKYIQTCISHSVIILKFVYTYQYTIHFERDLFLQVNQIYLFSQYFQ